MKICFRCKKEKKEEEFYAHKQMDDGHLGKCKECTKTDVKLRRKLKEKYYNRFDKNRYRTNIRRMWLLKYSGMRRRIFGLTVHSKLLGYQIVSRDEFLGWCEKNKEPFMKLYQYWVKSGYKNKMSPSIDRIDNTKGYIIGNMQWLTKSKNCSKYTK